MQATLEHNSQRFDLNNSEQSQRLPHLNMSNPSSPISETGSCHTSPTMLPPSASLLARPMSPQESLLTSSLANEKVSKSNGIQIRSLGSTSNDSMAHDDFVDDHPEPELLASSVGKEIGGRLIPSSSTISLLSLSDKQQQQMQSAQSTIGQQGGQNMGFGANYTLTSPTMTSNVIGKTPSIPIKTGFVVPSQPQHLNIASGQGIQAPMNAYNRTSSFSHLNQVRMYPYQQRLTSPPPANTNGSGVLSGPAISGPITSISNSTATSSVTLPSTPQIHDQHASLTSTQPISIRSSYQQAVPHLMAYQQQIHGINVAGRVPDSPNLNPTSLGASPSRFWLSSQTPPQSLTHPTSMMAMSHGGGSHTQPIAIGGQARFGGDHFKSSGSPVLNPVQTPKEEPPMTPLYLGDLNPTDSAAGEVGQKTEYFNGGFQI